MSDSRHSLPALSVVEASAIIVGIVVGIGIFKTPPIVAANVDSEFAFISLWLIGGLLTSTLLTLVFVPAMYTVIDDLQGLVTGLVRGAFRGRRSVNAAPQGVGVEHGNAALLQADHSLRLIDA